MPLFDYKGCTYVGKVPHSPNKYRVGETVFLSMINGDLIPCVVCSVRCYGDDIFYTVEVESENRIYSGVKEARLSPRIQNYQMDIPNEILGKMSGDIKEGVQIEGLCGTLHKGGNNDVSKMKAFEVTDVRFNVNHKTGQKTTCVMFGDGEKVVVKLSENDHEDLYTAFCAAVVKKIFGSTSKAQRTLEKASHGMYRRRQEPKKKAEPDGVEVKATWNNPEMLERLKVRYGLQYNDDSQQIFNRLMNDKLEGK